MFWTWLRNKIRDTFLAGVADGVAELEAGGRSSETDTAVALLRLRLAGRPATAPARIGEADAAGGNGDNEAAVADPATAAAAGTPPATRRGRR